MVLNGTKPQSARVRRVKPALASTDYMGTYVRLSDIEPSARFDPGTVQELTSALPGLDALFVLSRIDAMLAARDRLDRNAQLDILHNIFGESEIVGWLEAALSERDEPAVIFHSQQIYLAMNKILLFGNGQMTGVSPQLLRRLGYLLLAMTDECAPDGWNGLRSRSQKRRQLAGEAWLNRHLYSVLIANVGTELARAYQVFSSAKSLDDSLRQILGVSSLAYWAVAFVLYAHAASKSREFLPDNVVLDKERYFAHCRGITGSEVTCVVDALSASLCEAQEIARARMRSFNMERYNFEVLRERPLLEFQPGKLLCLGIPFLVWRTTRGLRDLLRMQINDRDDIAFDRDIAIPLAQAYEDYVRMVLRQAFGASGLGTVLHLKQGGREYGDAVIVEGDNIIVVEVKARSIENRRRLSEK